MFRSEVIQFQQIIAGKPKSCYGPAPAILIPLKTPQPSDLLVPTSCVSRDALKIPGGGGV
jgi:hypothetical protein